MKRIVLSLAVIAIAATVVVGATRSYFSDTEASLGTFTAGTIDIAIDGENPWTKSYNIGDLKPGETGYINFDIQNVGQNPVNVSKNLSNFVNGTGIQSEPECTDQQGHWNNETKECDWIGLPGSDNNDVQTQIIYDLSVEVFASDESLTPVWWQSIYTADENKSLTDVYGAEGDKYISLGMIPVGGHMKVTQSYHFSQNAGNEYQGDTLSFDITVKGEQLPQGDNGMTIVALENKIQGEDSIWDIVQADGIEGSLSYKNQGPKFDYIFTGQVKTDGNYTLLYVGPTNDYPGVGSIVLGTGGFTSTGTSTMTGQVDIGTSITNGKIWLIPSSSYNGSVMTSWPADDILFETGLINYTKN